MYQRKLIALAVAGALGVPAVASAQQSTVQIYGKLYPEFTVAKTSGATPAGASTSTLGKTPTGVDLKSRNSIDASNSRIGFRGTEDLGRGLKAIFQIETTVNIDDGASPSLANRDSFVGLRGGFGTVRLGNMTTVFKDLGDPVGILGISSGNFVALSNVISSRVPFSTNSAGSFHLRRANSLMYDSPAFGGFQVHVQYGPDEIRTGNLDANLWSLGVEYKRGPIEIALAHEIHNDFFAGSNALRTNSLTALANPVDGTGSVHSKDTGTRLTVLYRIGGARISGNVANIEFDESGAAAGKFRNYKNTRWSLTWEQRWSGTPWRTTVAYGSSSAGSCTIAGADCTTNGLNGTMLTLGTDYALSKRTALFALYARINNGSAALYRNLANPSSSQIPVGADIIQYAVGIRHSF